MASSDDLAAVIADFLADAATAGSYDREQLRDLRAGLAHVVASDLGALDVEAVRGSDVQAMADGLRAAGLSPGRVKAVVDSLRPVYAFAIARGRIRSSPLVGLAPAERPAAPSPTDAMLTLGEHVVTWTVRFTVIAFALIAVGLVVALA